MDLHTIIIKDLNDDLNSLNEDLNQLKGDAKELRGKVGEDRKESIALKKLEKAVIMSKLKIAKCGLCIDELKRKMDNKKIDVTEIAKNELEIAKNELEIAKNEVKIAEVKLEISKNEVETIQLEIKVAYENGSAKIPELEEQLERAKETYNKAKETKDILQDKVNSMIKASIPSSSLSGSGILP